METYAFDPFGTNQNNFIQNEEHTLTTFNSLPYFFILPRYGPLYTDDLSIFFIEDNAVIEAVEGKDYNLILPFSEATRSTGKPVYLGASFNNANLNTRIKINYRTIGGNWISNTSDIWRRLAEQAYNPRFSYADQVINKPVAFPPTNHNMSATDLDEFNVIIQSVSSIARAIESDGPVSIMEYLVANSNVRRVEELEAEISMLKDRITDLE